MDVFLCTLQTVVDGAGPPNKVWYCSKPDFCNWTNNPSMVTKTWWHNEYEVAFPVSGMIPPPLYQTVHSKHPNRRFGPSSLLLFCVSWYACQGTGAYNNLESHMNWVKGAWTGRPWVIAQGEGLFKHADANNFGGGFGSG